MGGFQMGVCSFKFLFTYICSYELFFTWFFSGVIGGTNFGNNFGFHNFDVEFFENEYVRKIQK